MTENEFLDKFNALKKQLGQVSRYEKIMSPEKRPDSLLGVNGCHFLQKLLRRSDDLVTDATYAVSHKRILLLCLVVRAHFETAASLGHFLKNLRKLYKGNISREEMDEVLAKLSVGGKAKPQGSEIPDPIGSMSTIDSLDDLLRAAGTKKAIIRDCYGFLSEYCHTNFLGGGAYKTEVNLDAGTVTFLADEISFQAHAPIAFPKLLISLTVFEMYFREAWTLIEKNETLPDFA